MAVVEPKQERTPISWDEGVAFIRKHLQATKLNIADQAQLELAFRDNPTLWRIVGDMILQTENNLIENMSNQVVVHAAMKRGVKELREKLGHKDAPAMEQMLIDQVVISWLNVNWIQRSYDRNMSQAITLTAGMYWEKRLTMAQARYTKALETLAKVRRLSKVTPLQVNIGGQQINVAKSNPKE